MKQTFSYRSRLVEVMLLAMLFASSVAAAPVYYLATDQTGAQTQIDVNHTSTWIMTPNVNFEFGGALLSMKEGQTTSTTVTLALYQGLNASGTFLGNVTLSNATFCAQVTNCGQFEYHQFLFTTPVALTAGTTYFANLTSPAPDTQSQAYFIKNNASFIADINAVAIQPSPVIFGPPPPIVIPEPGSVFFFASGLALLWFRQRRR